MPPRENQRPLPTVSDRLFWLDAGTIAAISVLICVGAKQLVLMSVLVPAVIALRCLGYWRFARGEQDHPLGRELLLLAICTALGGFNDWNTVVNKRIYDYTVPVFFPDLTTIPLWMLLYWGMILRFLLTLFRWGRLNPPGHVENTVWFGSRRVDNPVARVVTLLALVAATRFFIFRYSQHVVYSWLPFALGLVAYAVLLRPSQYMRRLLLLFLIGGAAIEVLYIQVGGLHYYHLGWIGGVPLWIALWWVLIVPIWNDIGIRIHQLVTGARTPVQQSATALSGG